ncbi:GrpB family protein [Algirhabdus cladophorae]|uniref:GrpB family protein n=1 Tax=Algirhabdus cladophorae TaxID=3377108 RepID=UPI003B84754B
MPITVSSHDPNWKVAFDTEVRHIKAALAPTVIDLEHIGSTSIEAIYAKPIIDLLGSVRDLHALDTHASQMEGLGYEVMGAFGIAGRRYFRKTTAQGIRTYHLHVFAQGSEQITRHLAFRDYLRARPRVAKAYSDLKRRLADDPATTWDSYMEAKDPFIKTTEAEALQWYADKAAQVRK